MATKLEWLRKPILIACLLFAADQGVAQTIWVDDDKNNLYTIDLGNNNSIKPIVTISGLGTSLSDNQITDIAFDGNGKLWGITFQSLYQIDIGTGVATRATNALGGGDAAPSFTSLVFGADGTLYAANQGVGQPSGQLFTVNTDTTNAATFGKATSVNGDPTAPQQSAACLAQSGGGNDSCPFIATHPAFRSSGDLAFVGGQLFLSSTATGVPDSLVNLDQGAVAGTPHSLGNTAVWGLATVGTSLFGAAGQSIYTVDTGSGAMKLLQTYSTTGNFNGATYYEGAVAGVPEPSTYAMLLAGLGFIGFVARRRLPAAAR
jgi:PEP-CTERM motif